ncbi:alpha/beta hydrolase family protein [Paraliomyxa miuraensis]|uniref:alpha/beta hydrolase family protein n=1 Tax=Paraliomyxa miuraensis TaxID=376150 RepID=UPI00225B9520|nr:alpha/beta fold hydrolase [Paraliomyxa miuraensis]MCX4242997.1 alpha/beta fold hydrolase [Paraliomyxa miuraensis]
MTTEATTEFEETKVTIEASDGLPLAGILLLPRSPKLACLVSPATGLAKELYLGFARFAAERGVACLLFDFRGTGGSTPSNLRSFQMDYADWGRLDMVAALDLLREKTGSDVPVVHLGNSVGGHMVGFMSNHDAVTRHVLVSVGFGTWWTHRFPKQQLMDLFFWWIYGPFKLAIKGYIPAGGIWGGTTLPAGAFKTWRRWSHRGDYFRRELEQRLQPHWFNELRSPILTLVFTDDPLTTPETARRFQEFMPNAPSEVRVLSPSDLGVKQLEHQNVYRSRNAAAWPTILEAILGDA